MIIGELSALSVSLLWTAGSIMFASAARRIGAFSVNALRIVFAIFLIALTHALLYGSFLPVEANIHQWLYLSISGLIGLAIGDYAYFASMVYIGPRRGVLLLSTAPIFATVFGYVVLGEVLGTWSLIGIAVTMTGVMMVILEQEGRTREQPRTPREKSLGVFFGLIAGMGQGVGLVISKYGMINVADEGAGALNPLSATMIRLIAAALIIWIGILITRRTSSITSTLKNKQAMTRMVGGTITGPFLGIWLSMIAVTYTEAGIAATLMSLMPVVVIPVVYIVYKQKTSPRSIIGAVIAVIGVAMLFLM